MPTVSFTTATTSKSNSFGREKINSSENSGLGAVPHTKGGAAETHWKQKKNQKTETKSKKLKQKTQITSLISQMQEQEPNLPAGSWGMCSTYDRLSSEWNLSLAVLLGLGVFKHFPFAWYKHSGSQQLCSNSSNKVFETSFSPPDKTRAKLTPFSQAIFSSLPRKFGLNWLRFF